MATFEGPHTLFDVAKFFLKLGCTEAMNLDGGGSTTMVVSGATVTRNGTAAQRHVAVALGVFSEEKAKNLTSCNGCGYHPKGDLYSFTSAADVARLRVLMGLDDKGGPTTSLTSGISAGAQEQKSPTQNPVPSPAQSDYARNQSQLPQPAPSAPAQAVPTQAKDALQSASPAHNESEIADRP